MKEEIIIVMTVSKGIDRQAFTFGKEEFNCYYFKYQYFVEHGYSIDVYTNVDCSLKFHHSHENK